MKVPCKRKKTVPCVAVLGSGAVKSSDAVYRQAVVLGNRLAREGFSICHGGYGGVMEAVARGCHQSGGSNTGVTIGQSLAGRNPWITATVAMPSWQERLFKLIEMGDAYIFLDGATGTLNELFFVWEMANKKLMDKPILLLGKRLHGLFRVLKKDPLLKIPRRLYLVSSVKEVLSIFKKCL